MHQSAMYYGEMFFKTYCSGELSSDFTIVEIGSQDVNGSLREVAPIGVNYIGLDFVDGKGVDVIIDDPYKIPLSDASADVVVTSSCFEHSEFFWLVYLEAIRLLKPNGLLYMNVPSNGFYHRWPVDCWRFYPDSGRALVRWAAHNNIDTFLLESFTGKRSVGNVSDGGMWNDFVAVIIKGFAATEKYPNRIVHVIDNFENGQLDNSKEILNHNGLCSDFSLIQSLSKDLQEIEKESKENKRIILEMKNSVSWRFTSPLRKIGQIVKSYFN